jgi:hypothetical protein
VVRSCCVRTTIRKDALLQEVAKVRRKKREEHKKKHKKTQRDEVSTKRAHQEEKSVQLIKKDAINCENEGQRTKN